MSESPRKRPRTGLDAEQKSLLERRLEQFLNEIAAAFALPKRAVERHAARDLERRRPARKRAARAKPARRRPATTKARPAAKRAPKPKGKR